MAKKIGISHIHYQRLENPDSPHVPSLKLLGRISNSFPNFFKSMVATLFKATGILSSATSIPCCFVLKVAKLRPGLALIENCSLQA